MSMGSSLLKEQFARRFEQTDGGYVFRNTLGAEGYEVSAAERDAFVLQFEKRTTWAIRGFVVGLTLLCIIGAVLSVAYDLFGNSWVIGLVVFAAMIIQVCISMWFWAEPVRQLRTRAPTVPKLSADEAKREGFRQLTWTQLGLSVGIALVCAWRGYRDDPTFLGWGRLWLAGAGLLLMIAAVQAFRKWRLESR